VNIIGLDIPSLYFRRHAGDTGIKAAQSSFDAWHSVSARAEWDNPQHIQAAHSKASILKAGRVVFNIKGNDYRLVCKIDYTDHIVIIRWFGTHTEYDRISAETI